MNLTERFSQLTRMQPDFVLAKTLETTNKPGAWIELSKIKEPIDNFTHRQQLDNELIIEIDASNMEESKKVYEQIKPKLKELWLNWDCWTTHSKSYHVHLFFNKKLSNKERQAFIEQYFSKEQIERFDSNFWTTSRHLIAIGGAVHYKSKKEKELIESVGEKPGNFPKVQIKQETKKSVPVKEKHDEILNAKNPTEKQRVALVMKLKEFNEWSEKQVLTHIKSTNKWGDFNEQKTKEKIITIFKNYADKKNPNQIEEVPSLTYIDFSKFNSVFENTHSHLPAFQLIDTELGLKGKEYYPITKFLSYYIESLRQQTIQVQVGTQVFDNRIHGLIIAGAGLGKGRVKHVIKLHQEATECNASRTHIEQLIGKITREKGVDLEKKGYFDRKALIGDEAQYTINEEDRNVSAIMKEFRGAMDSFGFNEVEKQLTGMDTLRYCPETRFLFLVHDLMLQPIFFDSGSYRRMFCFEMKPIKVNEQEAIQNLYQESKTKEMKEYIRTDALYIDNVEFPRETIDEIAKWILMWNKFTNLHPNQRLRSVCKRMFFSGAIYFFRLATILSITKGEAQVSVKTAKQACFDCLQFLLKTFELYGNKGNATLSRDVWKTDDIKSSMFLEWLHYNKATSKDQSCVSIFQAQNEIANIWGLNERQSRSVFQKLRKEGLIDSSKGMHDSSVWLGFTPDVGTFVNFETNEVPDLVLELEKLKKSIESGESGNNTTKFY